MQVFIFVLLIIGSLAQALGVFVTSRGLFYTHRSLGDPDSTLLRFMWKTPWDALRRRRSRSGTGTATIQLGEHAAVHIEHAALPREAPLESHITDIYEKLNLLQRAVEEESITRWRHLEEASTAKRELESTLENYSQTQRQRAIDGLRFESWGIFCIGVGLIISLARSFLIYFFPI